MVLLVNFGESLMSKTVKMLLVVSVTMAFAAFLYKDELAGKNKTEEQVSVSSTQETTKPAPAVHAPTHDKSTQEK